MLDMKLLGGNFRDLLLFSWIFLDQRQTRYYTIDKTSPRKMTMHNLKICKLIFIRRGRRGFLALGIKNKKRNPVLERWR
jgi:hypothetical protein